MGAAISIKPAGFTAKIDRCGYLLAQQRKAKPWMDELIRVKQELTEACDDRPGEEVRLKGVTYYVDLTPRELRREIVDKPKAFNALKRAIGLDKLIERITISFKVLDTALSKDKQAAFSISERSGPRDITGGLIKSPPAA